MVKKIEFQGVFFFILMIFLCCKDESKRSPQTKEYIQKKEAMENKELELLVGTFTSSESKGIYKLSFDTKTGKLGNKTLLVEHENPGFLYISKDRSKVYSANSGKRGSVSIFKFTTDRNRLDLVNTYPSEGNGACFIELNESENLLAAANYGSGSIVTYPIDTRGTIIEKPQKFQHKGNGPHPNQKSPHAHCVKFDPSGKFLYAIDLGIDKIISYPISDEMGIEQPNIAFETDPGDGPRHMIFHPTKDMAFIVNELSSSVLSVSVDSNTGNLALIDKQSTLPSDFERENACADIHLSKDGKFLYVSNRGHNSIAIFSVSEEGNLKLLDTESVRGDWPRNFTLSPNGKFLIVANERSHNISVFKVNRATGRLSFTGNQMEVSKPVCLKF